ncbi:MAG: serpin family protein [Planctomycetota bacterium]|nr:serpin family protein [Planctomycetota bacterium]
MPTSPRLLAWTRRAAAGLLALGLCIPLGSGPAPAEERSPTGAAAMAASANAFARSIYGRVASRDGNVFLSPYSVHAAMLLAQAGARGETAAAMRTGLALGEAEAGPGYAALLAALAPPMVQAGLGEKREQLPAYELSVANTMWGQDGLAFEPDYLHALKGHFGAPLARVDFKDSGAARKAINDWVARETREKITDIVPAGLPPTDTLLALANAIYFKASWAEPFPERATKAAEFTGPNGEKSEAQLMNRVGHFHYAEVDGAQVLELPYRDGHLSMVVYLPTAHDGLPALERRLVQGELDGERTPRMVNVKLAKFRVTWSADLTKTLAGMDMECAFDAARADFTGITRAEPLFIGIVLHKAFIDVDESGTEAAAATVVMMKRGSASPDKPLEFTADRPFAYEIRHRATGAILFSGRVLRP